MTLDLWGPSGAFGLGLPLRTAGLVLVLAQLLICLAVVLRDLRAVQGRSFSLWPRPAALALISLIVQLVVVVRVEVPGGLATPGLPLPPSDQVSHLLGAAPLVVVAGWFGAGPAIVIGLAAGFVRAGWITHSLLTPLNLALTAGAVAWLLRRPYRDAFGTIARRPLAAALVGGGLYTLARGIELFAYSGGSALDGLEFVVPQIGAVLRASFAEWGVAGLVGEVVLLARPAQWPKPGRLVTPPYLRSIGGRMVASFLLVGVVGAGILLAGDWALARASARELIEAQMAQTARQAAGGVPFFTQSGRSYLLRAAGLVERAPDLQDPSGGGLSALLASFPFFEHLAVFDSAGALRASASLDGESLPPTGLELEAALAAALAGVPQEFSLATRTTPPTAHAVLLAPLHSGEDNSVSGALVGWADLTTNPILQPVGALIASVPEGTAMLVAEDGTVLLHTDPGQVGQSTEVGRAIAGEVFSAAAPDGTTQLVYVLPVPGSPWTVALAVPESAVDRLAIAIAARLFGVMAGAGLIVVLLTYAVSRSLSLPLRQMTLAAESIARGNLARPVPGAGEDEVGRLAAALERMRRGLKTRLEEMDLLLQATQRMAGSFNLAQVLPPILMGVQDLTEAALVRMVLAREGEPGDPEGYQSGIDPGGWAGLDAQLLDLCRDRGRFVLENPGRAKAVLDLRLLTEPLEGLLALPMRSEEQFVGTLWLGYRSPHLFSSEEISLLTILAGQLGVSVANARLYQRAEQERLRLAATLEASPDAVLLLDPQGEVVLANPASEMVLRVSPEQARHKPASETVSVPRLAQLLRGDGTEMASEEIPLADGRVLFASVLEVESFGPHRGGRVCVLRDITHYKKLDMLKSEFVATVSHDLRTPLTLMRGYGTMLSMVGSLNDQQKDFARKILDSVDQMAQLVDGLLDLGRIEAGIGLSVETVDPGAILEDVIGTYRPQAANKQVALTVDLPDVQGPIEADPTLLRQALANLVDNAIKYTPPQGRVNVSAGRSGPMQQFRVEDSGAGIAPADQPRLFEKFFRARGREAGKEHGSGLGLAIVKSIAEQHGGRVTLESRLGSGSVFVLEVPLRQTARGPAEGNPPLTESSPAVK